MLKEPVFASLEELQAVVATGQSSVFVWSYEGSFNREGEWKFNGAYAGKVEPLIVDPGLAAAFLTLCAKCMTPSTRRTKPSLSIPENN